MIPSVEEANAMSEELDKKVKFEIVMLSPRARGLQHGRTEVRPFSVCQVVCLIYETLDRVNIHLDFHQTCQICSSTLSVILGGWTKDVRVLMEYQQTCNKYS